MYKSFWKATNYTKVFIILKSNFTPLEKHEDMKKIQGSFVIFRVDKKTYKTPITMKGK